MTDKEDVTNTYEPKLSPREHAIAVGLITNARVAFTGQSRECASADYRAAAYLHGWDYHRLHSAEPMAITRQDFLAAIKAAKTPDASGNYTPVAAAKSPFSNV